MNVEDASRELLHEPRRKQPHVSRKADQVNLMLPQCSHDFTIMLSPVLVFRWNYQRGEAETTGGFDPKRIGSIGNDDRNSSVGNTPSGNIPGDGFEVRTASREEDSEIFHASFQLSAI